MQERHYKIILYFISAVIFITLAIQVYWNYKNYETGKAQLVRDVQTSVDTAVEDYYENIASRNSYGFFGLGHQTDHLLKSDQFKNLTNHLDSGKVRFNQITIDDNLDTDGFLSVQGGTKVDIDSIIDQYSFKIDTTYTQTIKKPSSGNSHTSFKISGTDKKAVDSITNRLQNNLKISSLENSVDSLTKWQDSKERFGALSALTTKIVLSFDDEEVDAYVIDSLIEADLKRKNITGTDHELWYSRFSHDTIHPSAKYALSIQSDSQLLPLESTLIVGFNNVASIVLKRNLIGILLSIVLLSAVIGSLLYLLRIIREQKQLAEIKNDFISNMTHEFKTPIATIGVALESIQHFNTSNDPEKTKKYVDMSSQQIGKLNVMVEKLLETATLDGKALALNKQESNLVDLVTAIQQKYSQTYTNKTITFESNAEQVWASIDAFHMENALDNIIDNAVKYGGDSIDLVINKTKTGVQLIIQDSGQALTKSQASQIFEKFYRVPKGNTHDVKGFGIGLYYTKTIIEKHEGTVSVSTSPTTFKITLPYV
jgi:two-component system phosphate regulon sensor histidine kinase PhoR